MIIILAEINEVVVHTGERGKIQLEKIKEYFWDGYIFIIMRNIQYEMVSSGHI